MRNFISLMLSFIIILAAVPAVALPYREEIQTRAAQSETNENPAVSTAVESTTPTQSVSSPQKSDKVCVLLHKEGKTVRVSKLFYIISVLAKEIDIHAPDEALKAQAVCIQSFLQRSSELLKDKPYDITDNPNTHQSFLTEKALKTFWAEAYDKNYSRLESIVKTVYGQILMYQGESVLAAYHSSNAGMTESAENVWGTHYPYLQATLSIGDRLSSGNKSEASFDAKTFKKKIGALKKHDFSFSDSPSDWLGAIQKSPSGTVLALRVGGTELTGLEIRNALALKSAYFDVSYRNGKFIFTVYGYGHGVGLSQEGAKYMAQIGFSYQEILEHYYKGVEISNVSAV